MVDAGLYAEERPWCALHPGVEAVGVCKRCGDFICQDCRVETPDKILCKTCFDRIRDEYEKYSPWEDRKRLGLFKGFFDTIKGVLLHPKDSSSRIPLKGGYGSPLFFGAICLSFSLMVTYFYQALFQGGLFLISESSFSPGIIVSLIIPLIFIPISPVFAVVTLFIHAGIYHVCLLLVGARSQGFEGTFRLVCFAQAVHIVGIIPLLGSFVAWIWSLVILAITFKNSLKLTTPQAVIAALLPVGFGIVLFMIMMAVIVIIIGVAAILGRGM